MDGATIPMQPADKLDKTYLDEFEQELMLIHDPVTTEAERIQRNRRCSPDHRRAAD